MTDIELSYLLQKYRNHDISQDEFEKLKLWIDESEDNRNIVRNIIKSYKTEERYNAYLGTSGSDGWEKISRQIKRRPMIHRLRWTASVAASLVICLTIGSIIYFSNKSNDGAFDYANVQHIVTLTLPDGETEVLENGGTMICSDQTSMNETVAIPEYKTINVENGGNFRLILPDSTQVWLNSNTSLKYPVNFNEERIVYLTGEAYFDVTKTGKTFSVIVADARIRVLGTQFDVKAYNGGNTLTTLVSGKVEVSNEEESVILMPDQQAVISSQSGMIETHSVNSDIYTSWISGVFEFRSTPLSEIMEQFTQWYEIDIIFESDQIKNKKFTGSIYRDRSLEYSLHIIEEVSNVKFRKKGNQLIVYK